MMITVEQLQAKGFQSFTDRLGNKSFTYKFQFNSEANQKAYRSLGTNEIATHNLNPETELPTVLIDAKDDLSYFQFVLYDNENEMVNYGELTEEQFKDLISLI